MLSEAGIKESICSNTVSSFVHREADDKLYREIKAFVLFSLDAEPRVRYSVEVRTRQDYNILEFSWHDSIDEAARVCARILPEEGD